VLVCLEEEEDGGSPSGAGDELEIVDGLGQLQACNSLGHFTRNFRRRWTYPLFVPPPFRVFNQEEKTTNSEAIGLEERKKEDRSEETNEEEGEVSTTLP
jgi:hypothetical protein